MRKIAAVTPNSAANAGSRIDCDIAVANGSCKKSGRYVAPDSPRGVAPAGGSGISAVTRADMNAAILALPRTEPT
jgi:hypothetical protein